MNSSDLMDALDASQAELNSASVVLAEAPQQPWDGELITVLSFGVLGFTLIALALCTALLWKKSANALDVLRTFGVITIVGISAVLLITGFSKDQLTPIVGLFGAIAGYLLGREPAQPKQD